MLNAAQRKRFNESPHPRNPAQLCETRTDGRTHSIILHLPHSVCCVPNIDGQELAGAFIRAAAAVGRAYLKRERALV